MKSAKMLAILVLCLLVWVPRVSEAEPMGTAWTYQGRLLDANSAADGLYDFQFKLFDDPCTNTQQGSTIDVNDLDVMDGYFTVELNFGSFVFNGAARWLEICVRPGDSNGANPYSILTPRTEVTPTPYALYAAYAASTPDDGDWGVRFGQTLYSIPPGNVGIGTHNPWAKLEVVGNIMISNGSSLWGRDSGGMGRRIITGYSDDNLYVGDLIGPTWLDVVFGAGGNERMRIKNTGNVGIGTASPGAKLEVNGQVKITDGSQGAGKVLTSDAGGLASWQTVTAIGDSDWMVSNGDMYSIPTGNVGIGTTTPAGKLDVQGGGNIAVYAQSSGSNAISATSSGGGGFAAISGTTSTPNTYGISGSSSSYVGGRFESTSGTALEAYTSSGHAATFMGGNVGIGTTSPTAPLQIGSGTHGPLYEGTALLINCVSSGSRMIEMWNGNRGSRWNVGATDATVFGSITGDLYFLSGDQARMILKNVTGNVGIGTTEPEGILHVDGGQANPGNDGNSIILKAQDGADSSGGQGYRGGDVILQAGESTGYEMASQFPGNILLLPGHNPMGYRAYGYVGIGTTDPSADLHIASASPAVLFDNSSATDWTLDSGGTAGGAFSIEEYVNRVERLVLKPGGDTLLVPQGGNVGIGTTSPAYDLDVNGDIRAIGSVFYGGTEGNADGTAYLKPDYVFEEGYDVMSVEQVETYLKKENHLPWMTSAKQEKEENGNVIDMTRMAFETVETAENLQIQVIELNKLIKEQAELIKTQQKRITALEDTFAQNETLKQKLEALEKRMDESQFAVTKETGK